MRVAFTIHKFPPDSLGGTEIYAWSLGRALVARGHEVHIFYPLAGLSESEQRIEREGLHLWRAPLAKPRESEGPAAQYWHTFRDAGIESEFVRFLSDIQPDLVHYQHVQGVSARLIELAAPRPRILTLHDYWYFCANSQLIRPDREVCAGPRLGWNCVDCATARADLHPLRVLRPLIALPFAYRNAYLRRQIDAIDAFVAPSRFLAGEYARQGFPAGNIEVLENGVDYARLRAGNPGSIAPASVRPHFAFLGSLAWQKGVHVLIKAFNRLDPDASLTIYGSDKAFPDYGQELRRAAVHPNIRFGGSLDPRDVGAALAQIDCLVVPSVWYENSPLVIQEAFAMNVPVVASRLGALQEKVTDGVTGALFSAGDDRDLENVLRALIANPQRLAEFRTHIQPPVSLDDHTSAIESLYERAMRRTA